MCLQIFDKFKQFLRSYGQKYIMKNRQINDVKKSMNLNCVLIINNV